MQPHKLIIGVGLVALFITAGLSIMFGSINDEGDSLFENYTDVSERARDLTTGPDNITSKFSKFDSRQGGEVSGDVIYNETRTQQEELLAQQIEEEFGWEILIIGPYKMIQRFPAYFSIIGTMSNEIARILHIPSIFIDFAMFAVLVVMTSMIIYLILRFQPRND